MSIRIRLASFSLLTLLLLVSCQNAATTTATPPIPSSNGTRLDLPPIADGIALGSVHVRVDPDSGNVEVGETRVNQAIGDAYLVGLNKLNCDCFEITGISRDPIPGGTQITLDVAFKHPFTIAERPDLFGWDLKAIIVTDMNAIAFAGAGITVPAGVVANPTGYTEEWTEQIRTAIPTLTSDAFPYVILGEDRAASTPFEWQDPVGWNVFPSGGVNTGQIAFDLPPATALDFNLFFTIGYQSSAVRATRQTPDYQPPRGNSRAPWRVDVDVVNNFLTINTGSSTQIDLSIWDWQHGQSLGSDVTTLTIHAPTLSATPLSLSIAGGTGRDSTPLTASTVLFNNLGTVTAGTEYALIVVEDALFGANPGGALGEDGVRKIEDDFSTVAAYDNIRTFQIIPLLIVGTPNAPPIAALITSPPRDIDGSLHVTTGTPVSFDAATSSDPDAPASPNGDLVLFEYDWQWDGVPANFLADESHPTAIPPVSHTYPAVITTKMGLGVTDGAGDRTILTVDVFVTAPSSLTLTLDPIQDIVSVPDNYEERGATITEESDGEIVLTYVASHIVGAGRHCPGYRSTYTGSFSTGVDISGGFPQVLSQVEAGYFLKSFTNWGSTNTLYQIFYTDYTTHMGNQIGSGLDGNLGYPSPTLSGPPASCIGFIGSNFYSADMVISRTGGQITVFADKSTGGAVPPSINAYQGGPVDWCVPTMFWVGSVPSSVIDARQSCLSHWRSTAADNTGGIHLAYMAADLSRLSYARSATGTVGGFVTTDLATGTNNEFKDPTLTLDDTAGMYLVSVRFTAGTYQLIYFKSTDKGATWSAQTNIGTSFPTEPLDLAVSARVISGNSVIAVGYIRAGQHWLRYSTNNGASWTDVALSNGPSDYSAEILLDRQTGDFYSVFSNGSHQVKARHGVFS